MKDATRPVWLMPVATDAPGNPNLLRYAWALSELSTGQLAGAYDAIVSAAQHCGQYHDPRREYRKGVERGMLLGAAITLLGVAVLLVAGCDTGTGERIQPTKNSAAPGSTVQLPSVEWRIRTREEVASAWANSTGKVVCRQGMVDAFIGTDPTTGRVVAYTTAPIYVDDEVATALGHELMHEAFGNYHRSAPIADHKDECR